MAKRFVACPFCGGKIKDSAIKCMHCKKRINKEETSTEVVKEIEINNTEVIKTNIKNGTFNVWAINGKEDKQLLWLLCGFQFICLFGALFPYLYNLIVK